MTPRNLLTLELRPKRNYTKMARRIFENIRVAYATPEENIITQFDESDGRMFFINQGKFNVTVKLFGN